MADLSPILAELEKLYQPLCDRFWTHLAAAGQLPEKPVITLASKGRKRTATGWYNDAVWSDSQEDVLAGLAGVPQADRRLVRRAEVVIATEILGDPYQTASELLRQLVVHHEGVPSRGDQGYYPIWWQNHSWDFDHFASVLMDQPSRGWAGWSPRKPDAWKEWVNANMNTAVFEVTRDSDAARERPGSRMKKWTCGCTVIRSATRVRMVCQGCGNIVKWADKSGPNPWPETDAPEFNVLDVVDKLAAQLDQLRYVRGVSQKGA